MTLLVLLGILLGSYAVTTAAGRLHAGWRLDAGLRGRISLALVFFVTGLGHFIRTEPMAGMLPPWVPMREGVVYATGALEWLGAAGLFVPGVSRAAALCLIAFLVLVFPANLYAALNRVPMGGHEDGPIYLLIRGPFQALLVWWAWWFGVRRRGVVPPPA